MRAKTTLRVTTKNVLDLVLKVAGSRVLTAHEEEAISRHQRELVDALLSVYGNKVLPNLRARPGRNELLLALRGTHIPEALFLLDFLQSATDSGEGDLVEMGVAQGATSALLANEILDSDRHLWLYDSFQGLSTPAPEDQLLDDIFGLGTMAAYAGSMTNSVNSVKERLHAVHFPDARTHIVAGFVHLEMPVPERIAFAYLDFDLYEPILTGLRMLHAGTRVGSVLMIDDYKFFSSGVEQALSEFLDDHVDEYRLEESPPFAGHFCALVRV